MNFIKIKFGLKIREYAFDRFLELYVHFVSPERKQLLKLAEKTDEEILWSYFLAQDLVSYRFYAHDLNRQQQILLWINQWLSHDEIPLSTRRLARDYIIALGIPASEIETVQVMKLPPPEIPTGCTSCLYFHGQSYDGQILVCAIHPLGLNDCLDYQGIRS